MLVFGVFQVRYFLAFELNTGKVRTRKTLNTDTFYAVGVLISSIEKIYVAIGFNAVSFLSILEVVLSLPDLQLFLPEREV